MALTVSLSALARGPHDLGISDSQVTAAASETVPGRHKARAQLVSAGHMDWSRFGTPRFQIHSSPSSGQAASVRGLAGGLCACEACDLGEGHRIANCHPSRGGRARRPAHVSPGRDPGLLPGSTATPPHASPDSAKRGAPPSPTFCSPPFGARRGQLPLPAHWSRLGVSPARLTQHRRPREKQAPRPTRAERTGTRGGAPVWAPPTPPARKDKVGWATWPPRL